MINNNDKNDNISGEDVCDLPGTYINIWKKILYKK